MKINADNLKGKLELVAESLGFELVELTAPTVGGRLILRAFIYSPNGIRLDDCAAVSRAISDRLEMDDSISLRYTLEVSSLGLDRPLNELRDFGRRIGEKAKIKFNEGITSKEVIGIIKRCDDSELEVEINGKINIIPAEANPRGKILI